MPMIQELHPSAGMARSQFKVGQGSPQLLSDSALESHISAKDDGRTARLMDILACQRAEGGFLLDTKGAKALGVSLKVLKDAAKKVSGSQGVDGYVLVCTALVFAYLNGPAADLRETWGPVAEKSRKWLAKITKSSAPKVGEETLASWASTVTLHP